MDKLDRFIKAQENTYYIALNEIKNGRKRSHWNVVYFSTDKRSWYE